MSLFFSPNPSLLFTTATATNAATTTTTTRLTATTTTTTIFHRRQPTTTRLKSPLTRFSSNKPPTSPGWNPTDPTLNDDEESDASQAPTVTDEWGEKSDPENEQLTKLSSSDPPLDEDEWGTGATEGNKVGVSVSGNGSAVGEDSGRIDELKRCLVDSVYGTGLGFRASTEERAEIMELVTQLEAVNPTPAPTDALDVLDGNWVLLYTAFSELLPLLAVGTTPLLKVEKICQEISTSSLTINNSITFSSPFATFTSNATADFEVRSPSRIQVQFKEGSFQPPKIKSNISLPENVDIFGQNVNLSPVQQSLNPLQEAVANLAGVVSGQSPLKVPIPGERTKSWLLITFLDKDLRISRGDGGLFVLAKEGSPLLDQ